MKSVTATTQPATSTPSQNEPAQSPQPVASQPTASSTEPNALCQWRKRWAAHWIAETRQAMAAIAQEARDE